MKAWVVIYSLLLLILSDQLAFSQTANIDSLSVIVSAEVRWVNQFPSPKSNHLRKKRTVGDIFSLLVGEKSNQRLELSKPVGVYAIDPHEIWILDHGNTNIIKIRNDKAKIMKAFSRQKVIYQSLIGICYSPGSGILFTDSRMDKIISLKNEKKGVSFISDTVKLNQPTGLAWNVSKSELWVVETAAHRITIFDETGRRIRSFGSRGNGKGEFNFPTSIWIDEKGYVYIVDTLNYRVQIFDLHGNFISSFGGAGNSSGYFASPKGIATDSYGNIYVVDALFHVVQIFDKQGHYLYSFGSQGREAGQFWMPSGIFIDEQDNIYVADSYNSRIQIFTLTSIVKKNEAKHN